MECSGAWSAWHSCSLLPDGPGAAAWPGRLALSGPRAAGPGVSGDDGCRSVGRAPAAVGPGPALALAARFESITVDSYPTVALGLLSGRVAAGHWQAPHCGQALVAVECLQGSVIVRY